MVTYDIYEELDQLKIFLMKDGQNQLAGQIQEAVESGSVSTEVFMHVYQLISEFQQGGISVSTQTTDQAVKIVLYLKEVLGY